MPRKVIRNEPNICQKCGSEDIDYGLFVLEGDNQGYYEMTCNKCGWTGKEWYDMKFIETLSDKE